MPNNTKKEECHCQRTDRLHRVDSNFKNHTFERCWKDTPSPQSPLSESCKHGDVKLVGMMKSPDTCLECKGQLIANEIEIFNQYYEVGGFCDNSECKRYMILIA